jgi:cell division septation protein DedD
LVVALYLAVAAAALSDPLIAHAQARENAGDSVGAAELYSAWLTANPGASGSARVFDAYFRTEQDFRRLIEVSALFIEAAKGVPGAAAQFLRIARIFDISARTEEAEKAYLDAFAEGAPPSALLSAFLLSLEMNDLSGMQSSLSRLSGKGGSAELLLGALAALQYGDNASAQATLVGLAAQTGEADLALKAMWILYSRSTARGDSVGQAAARSRLSVRFPDSPESALASAASSVPGQIQVIVAPSPWPDICSLDDGQPASPTGKAAAELTPPIAPADGVPVAPAATNPAASTAPSAEAALPLSTVKYSVQAGAFQMKENADDLVGELTRHGLLPVVIHETKQGKDRYRVLATTGQSGDDARAIVAKLGQLGYSGFLIIEK